MSEQNAPAEEGHRSFSRLLEQLDEGNAHRELSAELHKLTAGLSELARATAGRASGKLNLSLSVSVEPNGVASVGYGITVKEPAKARPNSVFWLTKGANLTAENPRQQKLPLTAVPQAPKSMAEPEQGTGESKSV